MLISIQVLRNVTSNFSKENVLGGGGFGIIYRGELHDGTKIVVKKMESSVMVSKGLNEFKSEITILTKVRHQNLVSRLGYCLEGKKILSIALDVASGVEYLHCLAHQSFTYRDLKPSNILLGDDLKNKVSDFGLVRMADGKGCSVETKLAGAFGYVGLEYAVTGCVTIKSVVDPIIYIIDDRKNPCKHNHHRRTPQPLLCPRATPAP